MSNLNDKVAMRHMDVYMEQEEKYTEAVLAETDRLQSKLQSEMASRMSSQLSTPPFRWGPWKRIEQKLIDYNQEAERFGGYAYEEVSEVSPDHRFIAYTMYDKGNDFFKLCVRDLNLGPLCSKPQADWVCNVAWAKGGQALLYVVTDQKKKPYRIYCSMLGSKDEDVILLEEPEENVHVNIRHTKDFKIVTVYVFSTTYSKVFLINAADPLSGLTFVWECEACAHCIIEHHHSSSPRKWENSLVDDENHVEPVVDEGDIGEWQPDGSMKIIDRKKNIFKLSQGEYVAVENLENVFGFFSDLDLIWIFGNSFEACLVAVVNPNKQAIEHYAEAHNISGDFEALCENPKIKEYVLGELPKVGKENKLKGFEFVKAIHLDPVTFIVIMKAVTGFSELFPHMLQGKSDPYVVLQLDSQIVKSNVKWGTKEPTWNEDLTLYIKHSPTIDLQVAAWDANLVTPHKLMGNGIVSLESICDGELSSFSFGCFKSLASLHLKQI
ncbi:unnamed protein product [Lactuca virosa]|uniref:C2 domain-containing protein n=1 Tax=Lactuca virosa TaxID=75947 RepID=A0AAU9NHV4_9ASTR|nr:unnamed protein product [Lactuca virosa]